MVKGGDQNGHGLDMVHTDVKLILQHPSPFITHACESFFPLLSTLQAHVAEDPQRYYEPTHDPCQQNLPPQRSLNFLRANILVVLLVDFATLP